MFDYGDSVETKVDILRSSIRDLIIEDMYEANTTFGNADHVYRLADAIEKDARKIKALVKPYRKNNEG